MPFRARIKPVAQLKVVVLLVNAKTMHCLWCQSDCEKAHMGGSGVIDGKDYQTAPVFAFRFAN